MRIGILTYHKSLNNGSALQAYALKTALHNMGYDVEIIDYTPEKYKEIYGLIATYGNRSLKSKAVLLLKRVFFMDMFLVNQAKYKEFQKKYMSLSKCKYYYNSNFELLNEQYDVLITGSDQIWNTVCADCDMIFFLPIQHIARKIAYAPSCNDTKYYDKKYIDLFHDYDRISVREEAGKNTLELVCPEKKIKVVADPTLLIDQDDYKTFDLSRIIQQDYIFLYSVKLSDDVIKAANIMSNALSLPVYTMVLFPRFGIISTLKKNKIKYKRYHNSPIDFLRYIKYAKFIITDSFHGTAFSTIFNKPFYSIKLKVDHKIEKDERIYTILEKLGLKERYVSVEELLKDKNKHFGIDFKDINDNRKSYVMDSLEWLRNSVEGNEE